MEREGQGWQVGTGMWRRTVTVGNGTVTSATPCCDADISVPVAELEVLAEVTVHCPVCAKRWDLRFDPWKPGREALWADG